MCDRRGALAVIGLAVLLAVMGCKPKTKTAATAADVPAEDIAVLRAALTKGMQAVSIGDVTAEHVGRPCVVVARTPTKSAPADAPPPLGMVRILGSTTFYKGRIHGVSSEGLQVHAAYPTSGNLKILSIPSTDIQSIHVGK
jgi:hypothetical protein